MDSTTSSIHVMPCTHESQLTTNKILHYSLLSQDTQLYITTPVMTCTYESLPTTNKLVHCSPVYEAKRQYIPFTTKTQQEILCTLS